MSISPTLLETFLSLGIQAIIFDCDGVLVDTEGLKYQARERALAEYGMHDYSLDDYISMVGSDAKAILAAIAEQKHIVLPDSIIYRKREIYAELKDQTIPMTAMNNIVRDLYTHKDILGIKLGLASGDFAKHIDHNLQVAGLEGVFEVIVSGSEHLTAYSDPAGVNKPKPYIYIEAAKQLAISPDRCIAIEDTAMGIQAAKGAGMKGLAVPNTYTQNNDFGQADGVYIDPSPDLTSFMEALIRLVA